MNEVVGETKVMLRGVEYGMRPDFLALTAIETLSGNALTEIMMRFGDGTVRIGDIAAIFYCCARSYDKNFALTYSDVGQLVHYEGLASLTVPAFKLISYVMSGTKRDAEKKKDVEPMKSILTTA